MIFEWSFYKVITLLVYMFLLKTVAKIEEEETIGQALRETANQYQLATSDMYTS